MLTLKLIFVGLAGLAIGFLTAWLLFFHETIGCITIVDQKDGPESLVLTSYKTVKDLKKRKYVFCEIDYIPHKNPFL